MRPQRARAPLRPVPSPLLRGRARRAWPPASPTARPPARNSMPTHIQGQTDPREIASRVQPPATPLPFPAPRSRPARTAAIWAARQLLCLPPLTASPCVRPVVYPRSAQALQVLCIEKKPLSPAQDTDAGQHAAAPGQAAAPSRTDPAAANKAPARGASARLEPSPHNSPRRQPATGARNPSPRGPPPVLPWRGFGAHASCAPRQA
jgi:hypothetical protein